VWVDGVHFNIRLEDDRLCTLVMIGARPNGEKELLAVEDGYRESAESGKHCCATSSGAVDRVNHFCWSRQLFLPVVIPSRRQVDMYPEVHGLSESMRAL